MQPYRLPRAAERSPAVAMFWSYRTTTTKDKMLAENSLPLVQSHTLSLVSASHGTGADAFVEIQGTYIILRKCIKLSKSGQKQICLCGCKVRSLMPK